MAQSVELLLDERADAAVRRQWNLLTDAGLPSERRADPRPPVDHHCPHITLYAGDALPADAEDRLAELVSGLRLELQLGAVTVFGPRRGRAILVRQVTPSVPLLQLQEQVAAVCGAEADGQFGAGRWAPHVTLGPPPVHRPGRGRAGGAGLDGRPPGAGRGDCLSTVGRQPQDRLAALRTVSGRRAWPAVG